MTPRLTWGALIVGLLATACDRTPPRDTVGRWPGEGSISVGSCEFRLASATLHHSTAWQLSVEMEMVSTGAESAYCTFTARAMTSSDTPLTDRAKAAENVAPTEPVSREIRAREANMTGMSTGRSEGAWVYLELSEGYWPVDTRTSVSVEPQRARPPS